MKIAVAAAAGAVGVASESGVDVHRIATVVDDRNEPCCVGSIQMTPGEVDWTPERRPCHYY